MWKQLVEKKLQMSFCRRNNLRSRRKKRSQVESLVSDSKASRCGTLIILGKIMTGDLILSQHTHTHTHTHREHLMGRGCAVSDPRCHTYIRLWLKLYKTAAGWVESILCELLQIDCGWCWNRYNMNNISSLWTLNSCFFCWLSSWYLVFLNRLLRTDWRIASWWWN